MIARGDRRWSASGRRFSDVVRTHCVCRAATIAMTGATTGTAAAPAGRRSSSGGTATDVRTFLRVGASAEAIRTIRRATAATARAADTTGTETTGTAATAHTRERTR